MSIFRFNLENLETGEIRPCKTLKDVSVILGIPSHQARSVLLSNDKLYLHPKIKAITDRYIIHKNISTKL